MLVNNTWGIISGLIALSEQCSVGIEGKCLCFGHKKRYNEANKEENNECDHKEEFIKYLIVTNENNDGLALTLVG